MNSAQHTILFASCAVLLFACKQPVQTSETAQQEEKPEIMIHLPDTQYVSVSELKYVVDVFDTTGNARIENTASLYKDSSAILTFRGGPFRDYPVNGRLESTPKGIEVVWTYRTGVSKGKWGGGSGWTGQPVYINWPEGSACGKGEEIIVGSLSGDIHFIDWNSGQASRTPLPVGNPIKGSISLTPSLDGTLYFGQGIPDKEPIGAGVVNLKEHRVSHFFPRDRNAWRNWGAYDSSPVAVDRFIFRPGENGTVYKFVKCGDSLSLHSTLRYRGKGGVAPGIECSMAVYANYGYVGDNAGNVICINLDNMNPVWYYDNADDIDGSPVLEVCDSIPYIYVGCEVDRQGGSGLCHFAKLNALNGSPVWDKTIECRKANVGGKHFDGGMYNTPLLGRGDCSDLIFTTFCRNNKGMNGEFHAIDKKTGETLYTFVPNRYCWSSPVPFLTKDGKMYIVQGDCEGYLYLIEGRSGKVIFQEKFAANFESSPAVCGDNFVVGSRGDTIYKFRITY